MAQFQFVGRDKPNAQDLNNEHGVVGKKYGEAERNKASQLIQALPDDAREIRVQITDRDVSVTHALEDGSMTERERFPVEDVVTSDGVRHTPKDQVEHPLGAGVDGDRAVTRPAGLERRVSPSKGAGARLGPDDGKRRKDDA